MSKVFVGNFSFSVNDEKLKEFFSQVGVVTSAKVVTEGEGGRSRGFGFVEMSTADEAQKAIEQFDGSTWEGRVIKVSADRGAGRGGERRHFSPHAPEGESGGGGGGGGGYDDPRGQSALRTGFFRAQPFDVVTRRKKKVDPFVENPKLVIDYKDPRLLRRFMSERGRVLPRRMTGLSAANQRLINRAVKRSQFLGMLPITDR